MRVLGGSEAYRGLRLCCCQWEAEVLFTDQIEEPTAEGYDFLGYLCLCAEHCPSREPVSATSLAGDTGC